MELESILNDLEYAASRITKKKLDASTVESTCPEKSLLIAIRDLREYVEEGDK